MNKVIKKTAAAVTVFAMAGSMALSCGCSSKKQLIIYNWGEYIAEDTISKFEAAYPQYEVVYRTFETNETMYPNLSNGYDVIIPSDYMVCRLIDEDWIQPVDWSKLPNVEANMDPMFKTMKYTDNQEISDEVLDYAIPYLYCTVGLVYDANKISIPDDTTDPSVIWGVLFDEANADKVGMYDSMRESIGAALNYLGYSINTMDEGQLDEALQLLIDQKANLRPAYGVDNLKDKMASGELAASIAWSGDHIVMLDRIAELGNTDIDLKYVLPKGSNWSVDMMCVPTNCKNYEGAMDFINFMYDPEIALENCEYVGYSTPNVAAKAMLDPDVSGNPYYYPTEDIFSTLEVYYTSDALEERYTELWNTVKASA
ncbi:MAG: ABC transporter substrate-binding protein [Saccharofermentans sp.]|jgi:spermidine/putrescine transport system substrate-binding protein|nr:ABC transporter substrate-binding protein [Mageeibacillus sp.]MCI1264843.1 ABC transporter substrate-binding protein [Saccharofermentans sp.]MCI1275694.1 ABC transporter substrate-binding protein [Saccharofermentans sp.]MCI1769897.1 ABC transporter substrate-binding protein [Mageeibacillus sp.]